MEESLEHEIQQLFDWNPPRLAAHPDSDECPPLATPFRAYYDRHLDPKLSLKQVRTLPSLLLDISSQAANELSVLAEHKLPDVAQGFFGASYRARPMKTKMADATAVAEFYDSTTAQYCLPIASTLVFHPNSPEWRKIVEFRPDGEARVPPSRFIALEEEYGPAVAHGPFFPFEIPREVWQSMELVERDRICSLFERLPILAIWEIFSRSDAADKLIMDLDRTTVFPFDDSESATLGLSPLPLDALKTPWKRPAAPVKQREILSNAAGYPLRKRTDAANPPRIVPSSRGKAADVLPGDPPTPESIVQHAWSRAVNRDSTVIVFHSGNFERIGIRDRATQTLYLSDLIEVPTCSEPGYGKLHIGLYITIFRDALDRLAQGTVGKGESAPAARATNTPTKRRSESLNIETAPTKRQRTGSPPNDELVPEPAVLEAATRNLVLLRLHYGQYDSVAPASFLRVGPSLAEAPHPGLYRPPRAKKSYSIHECISLTLRAELGAGACSVVHSGTLSVKLTSGETSVIDVVAKIAILPFQRERLRHEYSIYRHLAPSTISGIPKVYGLFEDMETGSLALVMSPCGSNLWTVCSGKPGPPPVSTTQQAQFMATLKNIHAAGVRHRDLRLHNLMLGDAGEAFIVDFDCSRINPRFSKTKNDAEVEQLQGIFNGSGDKPESVSTARTASWHGPDDDYSDSDTE
ncbi:hypothetical protein C8R46DRAFT_113435 [Mycena filopes]|nr:hypothetical protein C8R46DRAFT_113435 [Mycena filopes]